MSLGALAFLNPWLLGALATLPLIYWLLRTVPPRPRQVEFPPTRILAGIENKEKTPSSTPWWLLLIRLLAAALVIFALAEPVLNPSREQALKGSGPIIIAIDNGWSASANWSERLRAVDGLISEAEAQSRSVVIVPTASAVKAQAVKIESPSEGRSTAAAIEPLPFAPDRAAALAALQKALAPDPPEGASALWITDGVDHDGGARAFADGLAALASGGTFAVIGGADGREALGVAGFAADGGALSARIQRAEGGPREGAVHAYSARGARLGEAPFKLADGETQKDVSFELPLELRNQVSRIEIASEHSAGAVSLLDARSQWQRVGILSGESQERSQPLLGPLYYIEKAILPFAEIVRPRDPNLARGIDSILKQQSSVLMLADVGTLSGEIAESVERWVQKGGILVRFAGPRLEKGGDDLLPVHLRLGGRSLGGALSWSTPQPLADFDDASLFAGLPVPADVTIKRQVLADPARLGPEVKVWARLKDGTPLVTASQNGQGQIILFHVTANSDWSSLPISGLFVDMLRRITALGGLAGGVDASGEAEAATGDGAVVEPSDTAAVLPPVQTLDGFGVLRQPPPTAQPIPSSTINSVKASLDHPPGYYGTPGSPRAINILAKESVLAALPPLPPGTVRRAYESEVALAMKPWLLSAALALVLADIIAVLLLQMGGLAWRGARAGATGAALLVLLVAGAPPSRAQVFDNFERDIFDQLRRPAPARRNEPKPIPQGPDGIAQYATDRVTLAYVLTGNAEADEASKLGLAGLCRVLSVRTAVEPNDPLGVNIETDEIAFFPVLYWPVLPDAASLPDATLAKIDAYMKQGGLIIFDTRDYSSGLPDGVALAGKSGPALQRLIGKLDLPRLAPVPENHVLTRSFYLLRSFPGRWDGGQLWVEASQDEDADDGRRARRADGVTSVMITSNDLAGAWALDRLGRPLYPTVPGGEQQREMAFRAGVNIVMHALTGNYKADQVHVPALLERLGQ